MAAAAAAAATRPAASGRWPIGSFLVYLSGERRAVIARVLREARVVVNGVVVVDEHHVLDPQERAAIEVTLPWLRFEISWPDYGSRAAWPERLRAHVLSSSLGEPTFSPASDAALLEEALNSDTHPFVIAVDAAIEELVDHGRDSYRDIGCKTSFHRKLVHALARRFKCESETLRDATRSAGWWDYGHCQCHNRDNKSFEHEGFHEESHVPVRVRARAGVASVPEKRLEELRSRREVGSTAMRAHAAELAEPCSEASSVADLPPELLLHVFSFLDVGSLVTASRVSRTWCAAARDDDLWRDLFLFFCARDSAGSVAFRDASLEVAHGLAPSWLALYKRTFASRGTMVYTPGSGAATRPFWRSMARRARAFEKLRRNAGGMHLPVGPVVDDAL